MGPPAVDPVDGRTGRCESWTATEPVALGDLGGESHLACIHGHCNIIIINNMHVLSIGISIPRKIFVACVVCFSTNERVLWLFIAVLTLYHFSSLHMPLIYVESADSRHFWCIRMIIPPLSSLSSSTDELRQGAKQLSRGVEQYYLSTEVSLLVSVWFGWRARSCDELGIHNILNFQNSIPYAPSKYFEDCRRRVLIYCYSLLVYDSNFSSVHIQST